MKARTFFITLIIGIGAYLTVSSILIIKSIPTANAAEPKKTSSAVKPDLCLQYQEKALNYLNELEVGRERGSWPKSEAASQSAAYSSYYLVCRDLERRK